MASVGSAPSAQVGTQPRSHTASTWSFVNSSGPSDHVKARRLIRENAMRDYWRRKKGQEVKYADGTLIDKRTSTESDEVSVNNLAHDKTSNFAWRIREMRASSAEGKKPHVKLRDNGLTEPAIDEADQCLFFNVDDARIMHEQRGKDAGRRSGGVHAWPTSDQMSNLSRSPGLGVIDPFNMLPIGGSPEHDSFVLSHCKSPLSRSLSLSGLVHTRQQSKR